MLLALLLLLSMGLVGTLNATEESFATTFEPIGPLLSAHVDNGHVNYSAFLASADFATFIEALKTYPISSRTSREEKLAAYINAYNGIAIQGILDGYSPSSIWSRIRFFKRRQYNLFNGSLSLFELEHERILTLNEPRVHFAIVCASKSCPPLQNYLFSPKQIDQQLDADTRAFVNDASSNQFDGTSKSAKLSRIFRWYEDDFIQSSGSLANFLADFIDDPVLAASMREGNWSFTFDDYDWTLNGSPPTR